MPRFLRITALYPSYIKSFYAGRPGLAEQFFADQQRALLDDCSGWSDFWSNALSKLGYECGEFMANAEALQKRWAKEQQLDISSGNWEQSVLAAQAAKFRPDVLFVDDHNTFTAQQISELKDSCPSIRLVIVWCGSPIVNNAIFKHCHVALSNIPELLTQLKAGGIEAHYLAHAFDPRILERIRNNNCAMRNFTFVGSIVAQAGYHEGRFELVKLLLEQGDLDLFSFYSPPAFNQFALRKVKNAVGRLAYALAPDRFQRFKNRPAHWFPASAVRARLHPAVYGLEMFRTLQHSRVALNSHIDVSGKSASNMRLFEATGVGSCLLTEWRENLHKLFAVDKEVAVYRSPGECLEKAKWLIANDNVRSAIAKAGQERTLRDHTFEARALQLDQIIKRLM